MFVGFGRAVGRVLGGLCECFEVEGEDETGVREREREAEAEAGKGRGVGIAWREEKEVGGYFGSSKQKVLFTGIQADLNIMLTMIKGMIGREKIRRDLEVGG